MKAINLVKYEAFDGKILNTVKECIEYEKLTRKINKIMKPLNPLPKDKYCKFANGKGYIQQEKAIVEKAKSEILELGRKIYKDDTISFGWLGRYADDSNQRELYGAWGRLANIDDKYREWGQGYYALHPNEGVQKPYKDEKD